MARLWSRFCTMALFAAALAAVPTPGFGQNANPFGQAGIDIDADNVLRLKSVDPRLRESQLQAARQSRRGNGAESPLRKVSLNRLEKAVAEALAEGRSIDDTMVSLAGLTRVEYVMYLPGSGDIVLAGPAETVVRDADGHLVGLRSGNPTLRLDDVIVALRAYGPQGRPVDFIGCSIDPTQEGLARMQEYFNQFNGAVPPGASAARIAAGMRDSLGLQTVRITGIPAATRFAQTMVEADYRMKLIGIGLERPPVRIRSWVERVSPAARNANSLQRWYFMPDYEGVSVSPDGTVLHLEGRGVKLVGEDERVDRSGRRSNTGKAGDPASQAFTREFTQKFDQLAEKVPVFYAMRNLIDLSVVAAYVRQQDMYSAAGWDLGVFASEDGLSVEGAESPMQVETAVNAIWKGGRLMTPIGGGIMIRGDQVVDRERLTAEEELAETQQAAAAPADLAAGQWWWD